MSVQDKIDEMDRVLVLLKKIRGANIPRTLSEANLGRWNGEEIEAVIEGVIDLYLEGVQSSDSQRVMSFQSAYSVLAEMEQKLAEDLIADPFALYIKSYVAIWDGLNYIFQNPGEVWDFLKAAWQAEGFVEFLLSFALETVTLIAIKKLLGQAFKIGATFEGKMRKRAFPQSTGKRFWRKRVARQ